MAAPPFVADRKSTRLNSSHSQISYAVFWLKEKQQVERTRELVQLDHEAGPVLRHGQRGHIAPGMANPPTMAIPRSSRRCAGHRNTAITPGASQETTRMGRNPNM